MVSVNRLGWLGFFVAKGDHSSEIIGWGFLTLWSAFMITIQII
jgi:hypothetical protein